MWKKIFKKSPRISEVPGALSLKERVAAFWKWYSEVSDDFYNTIENKRCSDLEPAVSAKVDELMPGFGWVFGPGEDGQGHSFTLTPEGHPHKRLAAYYWLGQAPILKGWTFYASRQPDNPFRSGRSIRIEEMDFKAEEIWLTPWVDDQEEKVDVIVWHPFFSKIQEQLRHTVTFLWLDEVLGEEGTSNWIGEIKLGDHRLADAMPLGELPEFIGKLKEANKWEKFPPHETFCQYRGSDPMRGGLRSDVIAGTTCMMPLVYEFPLEENPLMELGAEYFMIVIPADHFPTGRQVEMRGEIEDELTSALEAEASGKVLGGASGLENFYIDLVFYDGNRSRAITEKILRRRGLGKSAKLYSFVSDTQ